MNLKGKSFLKLLDLTPEEIGELILQEDKVDLSKAEIQCPKVLCRSSRNPGV